MAKEQSKSEDRANKIIGRRYRYTNDYRIVPALNPNGSYGKRVIYAGRWIRPANEAGEYGSIVRWMRLLTAAALIAVLGALAVHPVEQTYKFYLPVLVAGLFPLAYQIMGIATIPSQISYMDRQKYDKSFVRAGHSAVFTLVMLCISALGCLIYWIVAATGDVEGSVPYGLRDAAFALLLIAAGAAELFVWKQFRKLRTDTFDNEVYQQP